MKSGQTSIAEYTAYWGATCVHGVIALLAGVVIVFCSALKSTVLLMPLAIIFSLMALAAYLVLDSAIVLASSFMLPHHHLGRLALRVQGFVGVLIGVACFIVSSGEAQMTWFLYLAALQALCVAIAEFLAARGIAECHNSKWCYVAALIAALSSMVLLIFHRATGHLLAWLLYSYLSLFGLNLLLLSSHMLFEALRAERLGSASLKS